MRLSKISTLITTLTVATTCGLLSVAKPAVAANLTGLTPNNTLINFDSDNPTVTTSVGVTGLAANSNLLGIDYRPANGLLYGLTDTDGIYTINPDTGAASFVSTLSTSFNGGFQSGVDFNPVVDRLRVVGSNDQNFRVNVDTGATIVDTPLAFAAGDANFGVDPNISGSAYTNSFAGAPDPSRTTELIGIDYDLDIFSPQVQPNDGVLLTGGAGGLNVPPILGFDIFSAANGDNIIFIASNSRLFSVNLQNIAAGDTILRIGSSDSNTAFVGLAAEPIPEPSAVVGTLALGALGTLSMLKRKQLKRNQKQNVKA